MLLFKRISWRNFLSTGNVPNTIELNKYGSTLITGRNGEGKSTLLCALTFSLFGKPFRNINKGQLINSINRKNCVVEVEFAINGNEYRVIRGIKPNVFEIYCNGNLINQDAANRDYQKVLEQQVLKLNYKTFTQVVILGSATFVPFMQLNSMQRREVIEDILDIKIFSLMNQILKAQSADTKTQIQMIETSIATHKARIESQKKLIEALITSRDSIVSSLREKIASNQASIEQSQQQITELSQEIGTMLEKQAKFIDAAATHSQALQLHTKLQTKVDAVNEHISFFEMNSTCPSCEQDIPHQHKTSIVSNLKAKAEKDVAKVEKLEKTIEKLNKQLKMSQEITSKVQDLNLEVSALRNTVSVLTSQNELLQVEIESTTANEGDVVEEKRRIRSMAEEAISLVQQKEVLLESRNLQDVASILLKDTGVKTAIIKEYLPVMNKMINKYLQAMDFYVKFELDESFNEVIRSRGRDEFTYESFSEGEKRRLDLAILFTWRQIAKMKNSVNTNIMILDEILDGALDAGGIDYFLSIMNQFGEHTNVFVISHREVADKFDHTIRVVKKNDFSVIASC